MVYIEDSDVCAINIHNGFKNYGNVFALSSINMNVSVGSVYALLGPSGCGKTTLLNVITRQIPLDSGYLFKKWPLKVQIGYMPQEISLNSLMSIAEVFSYIGQLYGLKRQEIMKCLKDLSILLDLPKSNRTIGELSGGEQRRVSFAVTLIHDPHLLILDEPTVGLDPILRKSIWDYLGVLATTRRKTIIITTHYIEEARNADKVGLMRQGEILIEDTPDNIIDICNCEYLEDAFLALCSKQDKLNEKTIMRKTKKKGDDELGSKSTLIEPIENSENTFQRSRFFAEIMKNLIILWRNKPMLLFQIGMPIMMSLIWCSSFGDIKNVKLGVANEELYPNNSYCPDSLHMKYGNNLLSCDFVKMLNKKFQVTYFSSYTNGVDGMKNNQVDGLVYFHENYTASVLGRIESHIFSDEITLEYSEPILMIYRVDFVLKTYIKENVVKIYKEFMKDLYKLSGWSKSDAFPPISFEEPIFGFDSGNFEPFSAGTFMAVVLYYQAMTYTTSILVEENVSGILHRAFTIGLNLWEVFAAEFVVQLILILIQVFEEWFVIAYLYEGILLGNIIWIFALLLLQGVAGSMSGFLVASIVNSSTAAAYVLVFSAFTLSTISGLLWPEEGMHPILRYCTWLYPLNYSSRSLQSLMMKGLNITHHTVYQGFISSISWILIFFSITVLLNKFGISFKRRL